MKTLEIGKKYHLHNGWAKTFEDVWFNNSELISVEELHNGLVEFFFKTEQGKTIIIDGELIKPFNKPITTKCWMFIESQTQNHNNHE
jgi:hypothetical protein